MLYVLPVDKGQWAPVSIIYSQIKQTGQGPFYAELMLETFRQIYDRELTLQCDLVKKHKLDISGHV